jgi:hypothetical protein
MKADGKQMRRRLDPILWSLKERSSSLIGVIMWMLESREGFWYDSMVLQPVMLLQ